eukprot:7214918-Pyramimonas_sp.AAC.1
MARSKNPAFKQISPSCKGDADFCQRRLAFRKLPPAEPPPMYVRWFPPKKEVSPSRPIEGEGPFCDYLPDHPNPTRRPEFRLGG